MSAHLQQAVAVYLLRVEKLVLVAGVEARVVPDVL